MFICYGRIFAVPRLARVERERTVASGVTGERVLDAMREVPREALVGAGYAAAVLSRLA